MVNKRETVDSVHNGAPSDNNGSDKLRKDLKQHINHAFYTVVTTVGIGIIAITMIVVLTQNRSLSTEIRNQTDINQRYLRCIILLPKEAFADIPSRIKALDQCSEDSRNSK